MIKIICKISIPFESEKNLKYNVRASSVMHGLLMEKISRDFAEKMHKDSLRPFSQYVRFEKGKNIWTVSAVGQQACENIIVPLMNLKNAYIKYKHDNILFSEAEILKLSYDELLRNNYIETEKYISRTINIITPAAFKSSGNYVILPTLRLIFLSLARKFDNAFGIVNNNYEILAEETEKNISVSDYKLSSASFSVEGVKIPSFSGYINFRISGDTSFKSYVSMLCNFAEYSGIGIKNALGMGQVFSEIKEC
ncbi:MAG: CRISPR system precrRNA processing endoribonuclease RAMP protein Cas6 [Ruminococcus sp.]|nr:CRISPR system precrRNA processing endoribonuclease RAMP protein Cas6 [Ruminococcus sp.]